MSGCWPCRRKRRVRKPTLSASGDVPKEVETTKVEKLKVTDANLERVNQYQIKKLLGKGAYGAVYQAADDNGELVAIKVLDRSLLKRKPMMQKKALEDEMREIAVMKRVNHPHCVQLFEVIDDAEHDRTFLILELLRGGHVMDEQNLPPSMNYLPETCARVVFRELLLGLEYLHGNSIMHRDIKPENLVFREPPPWSKAELSRAKLSISSVIPSRFRGGSDSIAEMASAAGESMVEFSRDSHAEENSRRSSALHERSSTRTTSIASFITKPVELISNLLTGPQPPAVADPEMVVLDMAADGTDAERQSQSALPRASPPVSPPVVKGQTSRKRGNSFFGLVSLTPRSRSGDSHSGDSLDESYMQRLFEGNVEATLKLVDFGVSHISEITEAHSKTAKKIPKGSDDFIPKATGTPPFYAPEMCVKGGYHGRPADIWAAGVTLCMLAGGALPFDGPHLPEIFRRIQEDEPDLPGHASPALRELLLKLLHKDPKKRATMDDLRQDPWVTMHNKYPMPTNLSIKIQVTDEDVSKAISTAVFGQALTLLKVSSKFKQRVSKERRDSAEVTSPKERAANEAQLAAGLSPVLEVDSAVSSAVSMATSHAAADAQTQQAPPLLEGTVHETTLTVASCAPVLSSQPLQPAPQPADGAVDAASTQAPPTTSAPPPASAPPAPPTAAAAKPIPRHPAMLRKAPGAN